MKPPTYWGYRFIQGYLVDKTCLWSADAVFGFSKYDYFKVVSPDGTLFEAPTDAVAHKQDVMFCYVDGMRRQAEFEELGVWDLSLKSSATDSCMRQRYGRVRYNDGKTTRTGVALTEYCFGRL